MTNPFLKKTTLLFSIFSLLMLLQSCEPFGVKATGDDITMSFDETGFHGLDIGLSANVEVRVGSAFKIEVTCEETAMPYVETRVSNGILKIYFNRNVYDVDHMKIVVTAPSWDSFDLSGSGYIKILDAISGDELNIDVSGSGNVKAADAVFNKANLEVSGSGDVELAGSADDLRCSISGSGNVDCLDFPVKTAQVKVSGSGRMKVNVSETLDADVSGSGDIYYEGDAQVNVHISGSGNVRKI